MCAALGWREDFVRKQRGLVTRDEGEGEGRDRYEGDEGLWDTAPSGGKALILCCMCVES